MRLQNNFYTILESEGGCFHIRLNPEDPIYKAHFPGAPVTPGVCTCRIVCELAGLLKQRELKIVSAKNIKFLLPIIPTETPELDIEISCTDSTDGESINVKAQATCGEKVFAKLSLTLE